MTMAKQIPLTRGLFAVVDEADFAALNRFRWHAVPKSTGKTGVGWYAKRMGRKGTDEPRNVYMHRAITGVGASQEVDHRDGDGLNNRRQNLRPASRAQNCANTRRPTASFRGVSWDKAGCKWRASIQVSGRRYGLGAYKDPVDAALAYDEAARRLWAEFAVVNFPKQAEAA